MDEEWDEAVLQAYLNYAAFVRDATYAVMVTRITDPGNFYVRNPFLDELMLWMEVPGTPVGRRDIAIAKRVIYQSRTLKKFVRGDIDAMTLNGEQFAFNIKAIDYGWEDQNVVLENIYNPHVRASTHCPPLAKHCMLYFCHPGQKSNNFTDCAIETMNFCIKYNKPVEMVVKDEREGKLVVQIKSRVDLSTLMAFMNCTKLVALNSRSKSFVHPRLPITYQHQIKPVSVGDRLSVRLLSGICVTNFYVAEVNDYAKLLETRRFFEKKYNAMPRQDAYTAVTRGVCCLVRYADPPQYDRGVVKDVFQKNHFCLVQLIDWGKEIVAQFQHIRRPPCEHFIAMPTTAIHCATTVPQLRRTGLREFFEEGSEFIIEIVKKGDKQTPHKVKLYSADETEF